MLFEFKISQIIVETDLKVNTPLPLKYTRDELHCGKPETFTSLSLNTGKGKNALYFVHWPCAF